MNIRDKLLKLWNLWPPFLFSGIKILKYDKDFRKIIVKLKLRFWNANFVGTQFGGLIFTMTDPFYMVMLIKNLGPDYTVWDKSASISYLKPGRTDLTAEFVITEKDLHEIIALLEVERSIDWVRQIEIKDAHGVVVAKVDKVVYIRKKQDKDKQDRARA